VNYNKELPHFGKSECQKSMFTRGMVRIVEGYGEGITEHS